MDSRLLDALRNGPSLDLYELSVAIDQMLSDPRRILDVRRHLHLGAQVMYFDHRRGALAPGRVVQMHPTQISVQDDARRNVSKLPYAAIVPPGSGSGPGPGQDSRAAAPPPPPRADIGSFKPGDTVSFSDKHLRERVGTITRINTKTCSVLCEGEQWRVSPGLLRKLIDL